MNGKGSIMKTVNFYIANYCVPCGAHCRYCLLSSKGMATGVPFDTGLSFAGRVLRELREQKKDISGAYYIGYCMDSPRLVDYIRFCKETNSPGARFLQMNGFAFRSENELHGLLESIQREGVELIDITFYGTEEYHDRFAGRKGDFAFMLEMLSVSEKIGLPVSISIPLLRENMDQMTELRRIPEIAKAGRYSYFIPHSKGRGCSIQDQRITKWEYERLPEEVRAYFQKTRHMTEAEWIKNGELTEPEKRSLTLVLTPENLSHFNGMKTVDIVSEIEALDDEYLRKMPSIRELAERFGRKDNEQLYRLRDLVLRWQQEFISEAGHDIFDMHDETHHFSVHM